LTILKILTLAVLLSASTLVNATLLTDNDYITVNHNGIDLDWAWASNYNVQFYYELGVLKNELYAPTVIESWREATIEELSFFSSTVTASDFLNTNTGGYKIATSYFNSDIFSFSTQDFGRDNISGTFVEGSSMDSVLTYNGLAVYDTFYVRNSSGPIPMPIPEPLTLLIFVTAFIFLQMKSRKNSA
tara:strand:- start:116 stop:676 length:561 start_codon:yes stop_codon:yes gene_type:complete